MKVNHTEIWHLNKPFNCETHNCIYLLDCKKCWKRYIGETGRMMKARLSDHRGYINNLVSQQVTTLTSQATVWHICKYLFTWLFHDFLMTLPWLYHDFGFTYFSWLSHDVLKTSSRLNHDFLMTSSRLSHNFLITFS